jgi:hypothetical protein
LADRFLFGVAPIDYSPVLLLMPFGFHLAMDTLPSGELLAGGFRSALARVRLSLSCPFRLLHTFHLLRPARHYPRVRIWRSSFERQRDFNPPEQRAAQRTLRVVPPLASASVLSLSWFFHLSFSVYIGAEVPTFRSTAIQQIQATSMPDAASVRKQASPKLVPRQRLFAVLTSSLRFRHFISGSLAVLSLSVT